MPAKLTLIGLYNDDNTLFENIAFPTGIDKSLWINSLLQKCGEFEVLYPDPEFLKPFMGVWSAKWYKTFEKWIVGFNAEWNPIHNYDRTEEWEDHNGMKVGSKTTSDYNTSYTAGVTHTFTRETAEEREHKISAFNDSGYNADTKDITSGGTTKDTGSGTDKTNVKGTVADTNGSTTENKKHTGHIYGNIGVTQASEMLESYYEIAKWNLYDHISDVFAHDLLILVY